MRSLLTMGLLLLALVLQLLMSACGSCDEGTPNDVDGDGIPNSSDLDDDNDGVPDTQDGFPLHSGAW